MNKGSQSGFSLIESLIVISIISIMSALSLQALPIARSNQELIGDTEQIRALLSDAKERALNQVRPSDCLPMDDMTSVDRSPCSDVGIAFSGSQVIEFADTNQNNYYDDSSTDYVIATYDLTAAPGNDSVTSLVFKSIPPSVLLYSATDNSSALMGPSDTATIVLDGYGDLSRTLIVHSYGTIDLQ